MPQCEALRERRGGSQQAQTDRRYAGLHPEPVEQPFPPRVAKAPQQPRPAPPVSAGRIPTKAECAASASSVDEALAAQFVLAFDLKSPESRGWPSVHYRITPPQRLKFLFSQPVPPPLRPVPSPSCACRSAAPPA